MKVNNAVDLTQCQTPAYLYDLNIFRTNLAEFKSLFPDFRLFYSTKTNPLERILQIVKDGGDSFDAASVGEIDILLGIGVEANAILFTHPIKFDWVISEAYSKGVRKFTFDSIEELKLLVELAPGSTYMLRILPPAEGSFYEYSDKFGAQPDDVTLILAYAQENSISIAGISFHIGSQNMETGLWKEVLMYCRGIFEKYGGKVAGFHILNIGSGFPARYIFDDCPALVEFSQVIHACLATFPPGIELWCEPGRVLVADTAVLVCSVIRTIQRKKHHWLFLNFGVYHGLIEILESRGRLTYKIESLKTGDLVHYSVSGNTLDPDDILASDILLPGNLEMGDRILIHDVGAYTSMFFTGYHALPAPVFYFLDDMSA